MMKNTIYSFVFGYRHTFLGLCSAMLMIVGQQAIAGVAVVVDSDSSIGNLTKDQVKSIFLIKKKAAPDGTHVVPASQVSSATVAAEFRDKVLDKDENSLRAYWAKMVFSGKGIPPHDLDSDAAVKDFVNKTPGGIGVIDSQAVDGSIKVVFTAE